MKVSVLFTASIIAISASATKTITPILKRSTPPEPQYSVVATEVYQPATIGTNNAPATTPSTYDTYPDGLVSSEATTVNAGTVSSIYAVAPRPSIVFRAVSVNSDNVNRLVSMIEAAAHSLSDFTASADSDSPHTTTLMDVSKTTITKMNEHTATSAHTANPAMATTTSQGAANYIDSTRMAIAALVGFAGLLAILG